MAKPLQPHACLWCGATRYTPSREHIIPEALGCPDDLVLQTGVCAPCNHGLGHVDQALVRQFEVVTVIHGIARKKGKRPTIESWGPLRSDHDETGPSIHLNAGPGDIPFKGRALKAAGGETGVHSVEMKTEGNQASVSFSMDIGRDRKLLRALYKIGLEAVACFQGHPRALEPVFDPVRAFVRSGEGRFSTLVLAGDTTGHEVLAPVAGPDGVVVPITLFGVTFVLDLRPDQPNLAEMEAELRRSHGAAGWSRIDYGRR